MDVPRNRPMKRASLIRTPIIGSLDNASRSFQKLSSIFITDFPSARGRTKASWQVINLKKAGLVCKRKAQKVT